MPPAPPAPPLAELPRDPRAALAAVARALDGGPALLALPPEPAAARALLDAVRPDEPLEHPGAALVVGTSGSTGGPKGVVLTAAALRASGAATAARVGTGRWLLALPLHHVAGLQVLCRSALAGTAPVVQDLAGGFTAAGFAAATDRLGGGPRLTSLVPTQLGRVLDDAAGRRALATYDAVLVGGAAAARPLLERAGDAGARVVTTYGMSETCGGCVYDGAPLDGVDVALRADGRITLAGPVLMAGYRLRPDLTAQVLHGGRFTTGDLGRWGADGRLEVLGRADDVLVSGGENVPLAAVEAVVAEHPGVREACAAGLADPEWGQVVGVAVVATAGDPPDLDALRALVAGRLGRAAAPRALAVVPALPLLGVGKPDRRAVAALLAAGRMPDRG
ncbi:o-succinylbenzoate--CoA ligase [Vallicoccus soli]|uniref:AMP-dependent synthetase n=1 Tax=Vallicoccus soli TaxID=2339232 RepID=A0A3A3YUB2_9ACTN|nr:o-succinylbenzoate--CoA ligase [Vallicoccus soli]RJK93382.1 AMP-dependent synthetase [Vallicoccus soli]